MSLPASADSFYAAQCCGAIIVMMPCGQRAMTQPVLALLTVARVPGVAMIYVYTWEKDAGAGYSVCRQPFPLLDCASVSASSFFLSLFPRHGGAHRLTKFLPVFQGIFGDDYQVPTPTQPYAHVHNFHDSEWRGRRLLPAGHYSKRAPPCALRSVRFRRFTPPSCSSAALPSARCSCFSEQSYRAKLYNLPAVS